MTEKDLKLPEDFERRMKRVSELRKLILTLKRSLIQEYELGNCPIKPYLDIRSDVEYWRKLAREKGYDV
jgi:hypothetical protein